MTLRAAAALGISLAVASLLAGCYYPTTPVPAYAYYPPGCIPSGTAPAPAAPPDESNGAPPAAGTPCQLVPTYAYPSYPYYYPYYGYPGYYAYPPVSVGVGARFRL